MIYQLKERGENDRIRLAKIFKFQRPDDDTLNVLSNNFNTWTSYPESFWMRPMPSALGSIAAEAQIVGCFIQTKRDDA